MKDRITCKCAICGSERGVKRTGWDGLVIVCDDCMDVASKVSELLGVSLKQVERLNASPYCCVPEVLDNAEERYE